MRVAGIWVALAAVAVAVGSTGAADKPTTLKSALKQVSRATRDLRAIVAEVEFTETVGRRVIPGTGTVYVHFDGYVRADIGGVDPRTVLFSPPYLYVYRESEQRVLAFDVTSNPHRLGQYLVLGFMPAGKGLKKNYNVVLVPEGTLDGKPAFHFLITPKSRRAAAAVARIGLWVDPASGLPLQHEITHAQGEARLDVRYLRMSLDEKVPLSLFRADWPEDIAVVWR